MMRWEASWGARGMRAPTHWRGIETFSRSSHRWVWVWVGRGARVGGGVLMGACTQVGGCGWGKGGAKVGGWGGGGGGGLHTGGKE
jgi:hypothetical protein